MFIYRDIGWRELWRITLAAVFLIAQILIIVTAAGIYSWLLTTSGIPQSIVSHHERAPSRALADAADRQYRAAADRKLPRAAGGNHHSHALAAAVVEAAGVHPIHFGIIMAVNLSIGMYTPPFGLNLFASQAIFNQPLAMIYRGVVPFVLINFATLMLISYVPWISLGLLNVGR